MEDSPSTDWTPIELNELLSCIQDGEQRLAENIEVKCFWDLIKIEPQKWIEVEHDDLGGGFWAVGLVGKKVIWYNDIEEGFNISSYSVFGRIDTYECEQLQLNHIIQRIFTDNITSLRHTYLNR